MEIGVDIVPDSGFVVVAEIVVVIVGFCLECFYVACPDPNTTGWGAAFRILRLVAGSCCSNTSYAGVSCFTGGYSLSLAPVLVTAQESKVVDVAFTARPSHRFIRIHLFFGSPVSLVFPFVIKF